jgi:hypothetical protein
MENVKTYDITDEIYYYYRFNTKENINVTKEEAKKRITRNVLSGKKYKTSLLDVEIVFYENLIICIENDTVVWMSNVKGFFDRQINKDLREELNKEFNIL